MIEIIKPQAPNGSRSRTASEDLKESLGFRILFKTLLALGCLALGVRTGAIFIYPAINFITGGRDPGLGGLVMIPIVWVPAAIVLSLFYGWLASAFLKKLEGKAIRWILVLIIFITGMALTASLIWAIASPVVFPVVSKVTGSCEGSSNEMQVVRCYEEKAIEAKDLAYCDKIGEFLSEIPSTANWWVGKCYSKFAGHYKDVQVCKLIKSTPGAERVNEACYSSVAVAMGDPGMCENITLPMGRDQCYLEYFNKFHDSEVCSKMENLDSRMRCTADPIRNGSFPLGKDGKTVDFKDGRILDKNLTDVARMENLEMGDLDGDGSPEAVFSVWRSFHSGEDLLAVFKKEDNVWKLAATKGLGVQVKYIIQHPISISSGTIFFTSYDSPPRRFKLIQAPADQGLGTLEELK